MSVKKIALTVTVDQTNLILEALGQLPFIKVYELIGEIQAQAKSQLEEAPSLPTQAPSIVGAAGGE